jgi:hypothetical protein
MENQTEFILDAENVKNPAPGKIERSAHALLHKKS